MPRKVGRSILHGFAKALSAIVCLLYLTNGWGASIEGQVLSVKAGDLITLIRANGDRKTVRLLGISAPPGESNLKRASKRHLQMLLAGKFVSVSYHTVTAEGEILGRVLHGGSDIGLQMLEAGLAQVKSNGELTSARLDHYREAQRKAQVRGLGLWRTNDQNRHN
jgi:endonuclease YncB( thermonuclease family)